MRNNTEPNQSHPWGKTPEIHITHEQINNCPSKEAIMLFSNPECGSPLGSVQTAADQVKYLPRFCRLYDFPSIPGLFYPGSAPCRETLKKWRRNGTLVMVKIGPSLFVDVHMTFKKGKIKLGVLNN